MIDLAYQTSISPEISTKYGVEEVHVTCPEDGGLMDVEYEWDRVPVPQSLSEFTARRSRIDHPLDQSGVWRFRELLPFAPPEMVVTIGEGQTQLRPADQVAKYVGVNARPSVFAVRRL